jgi:hypothetical protein
MLIGAHIRQALDVFAHFDPQPFAQSSHVRCGRRPVEAVGRTQLSGTKERTQIVDHTVIFTQQPEPAAQWAPLGRVLWFDYY